MGKGYSCWIDHICSRAVYCLPSANCASHVPLYQAIDRLANQMHWPIEDGKRKYSGYFSFICFWQCFLFISVSLLFIPVSPHCDLNSCCIVLAYVYCLYTYTWPTNVG